MINFYYTRKTDLSYMVNYLDKDGKTLRDARVVGSPVFEARVTENAAKKQRKPYQAVMAGTDE